MANPSRDIGTRAETKVVRYLAGRGLEAERRALSGRDDKGDVKVTLEDAVLTIEVKAGKMTANPNRSQLDEWLRQTRVEAANAGCTGVLVVVRYRRSIEDADVYMIDGDRTLFMHLDELADMLT